MEKLIVILIVLAVFGAAIAVVHRNHKREMAERRAAARQAARAEAQAAEAAEPPQERGD
jgi:mannose/fructose/N-acetylgalactosamine-specific phosphotransferase system component IIC